MVDPVHFTNFNRSVVELEEVALFSILVAGKNALSTAKALDRFLNLAHEILGLDSFLPFYACRQFDEGQIADMLFNSGVGCYTHKAKGICQLVNSGLDLKTCTIEDLEKIYLIGPKTARMFVLHTRPAVNLAVLDVHILRYMSDCGVRVPKTTPQGKRYKEIEVKFLEMAKNAGKSAADFDLYIWRKYSGRENLVVN